MINVQPGQKLTLKDLKGCWTSILAQKRGRQVVMAGELRVDKDGFSVWFWVWEEEPLRKRETQQLATAIRWFNQAGKEGNRGG